MSAISVAIVRLPHGKDLPLPDYATPDSAGFDLLAAVDGLVALAPGERCLVPTGLVIALPTGCEAQVRPRSGLALDHGITVLNSPGTIDADYRGEVKVILANLGSETFTITRGMRIAQMVVSGVARTTWREVASNAELPASRRGTGGFGSTGTEGM